jgi:hypothetical protein
MGHSATFSPQQISPLVDDLIGMGEKRGWSRLTHLSEVVWAAQVSRYVHTALVGEAG